MCLLDLTFLYLSLANMTVGSRALTLGSMELQSHCQTRSNQVDVQVSNSWRPSITVIYGMFEEVNLWRFVLYADEEMDGSLLSSVSHSPITN